MKLGLLADIHEAVDCLKSCLDALRRARVDSFVILGDVLDEGARVDDTIAVLAPLPSVGVWGNHDFGLCGEVVPEARARFSASALEYFASLRPSVEIEGCRFQHIDPHLDPTRANDLWMFCTPDARATGFARTPYRRVFVGHHHLWAMFTPEGELPWGPSKPAHLSADQRYLVSVGAVVDGWCAVFDTQADELNPILVL